jgi:hypothetical protein
MGASMKALWAGVAIIGAVSVLPPAILGARQASTALTIDADAAIVTMLIRPERAAAFETILDRLKAALQRSANPLRKAQAAGWQVFRAEEQGQGNVSYVMRLDPVVRALDYDIAGILAEESPSEASELSRAFREAHVGRSVMTMSRMAVPGLAEPGSAEAAAPGKPARVPVLSFETAQAAVMTILIRPEGTADFEMTLAQLGKALQTSAAPERKRQASGWKVYKATQPFAGNAAYVLSLDPLVNRVEYDPIRLIQEAYPVDVDAIFKKYRQAFFGQAIARLTNRIEMGR